MDLDTILGLIITVATLVVLTGLVFWSRRSIERIARRGPRSAREILEDQRRG